MIWASRKTFALVGCLVISLNSVTAWRGWGLPRCDEKSECPVTGSDCIDALDKVDDIYTAVGEKSALVVTSGTCKLTITVPSDGCAAHRQHLLNGVPDGNRGGLDHVLETCVQKSKCGEVTMVSDPAILNPVNGCPWTVAVTQSV